MFLCSSYRKVLLWNGRYTTLHSVRTRDPEKFYRPISTVGYRDGVDIYIYSVLFIYIYIYIVYIYIYSRLRLIG